jgi:predicted component of viral defense system (DUF524 family)
MREARRHAGFLDDVRRLDRAPDVLTMVLLRRPEYRALFAIWQEMIAGHVVELDDAALEAPFENLPYLYELWGTLEMVRAVVEDAVTSGFEVRQERLFRRLPGSVLIEGLRANQPMVELVDPGNGAELRIVPQRSFAGSGALRSVSFEQVPDLAVELDRPGHETEVYLFDPKYKLRADGEQARPVKDDIDKMHAYRDAIISAKTGERVVRYAAILYPGPSCSYGDGVAALHADPADGDAIRHLVFDAVVRGPLCGMRPERPGDQCAGQAASRC